MATQLEIVNDLQARLRETVTASVGTSAYSQLLGIFVNDAKEYIEDKWFWTVNEIEIDTNIIAGVREYDLTQTTDRSFLIRMVDDRQPMAYDVTANEKQKLCDVPLRHLRAWRNTMNTIDDLEQPLEFAIKPDADGRGYSIELLQASTGARTWRTYWYSPQAELATDGTDDATNILLPKRPVFLRALFYALNERGEELGEPGNVAESNANEALAAALELDFQVHKHNKTFDLTNLEALRNRILGDI